MMGLTPVQARALGLIRTSVAERGVAPSYTELCDGLGIASKSGVHRVITDLEQRGAIRRLPGKARALEIVAPAGAAEVFAALPGLDEAALTEALARVVGLLAARRGVPETAVMLHRLGDRLPRGGIQ
jgi:repressor LexA